MENRALQRQHEDIEEKIQEAKKELENKNIYRRAIIAKKTDQAKKLQAKLKETLTTYQIKKVAIESRVQGVRNMNEYEEEVMAQTLKEQGK